MELAVGGRSSPGKGLYPGGSDKAGMDGWTEVVMQGMEAN